jgi:hypothetical protein
LSIAVSRCCKFTGTALSANLCKEMLCIHTGICHLNARRVVMSSHSFLKSIVDFGKTIGLAHFHVLKKGVEVKGDSEQPGTWLLQETNLTAPHTHHGAVP